MKSRWSISTSGVVIIFVSILLVLVQLLVVLGFFALVQESVVSKQIKKQHSKKCSHHVYPVKTPPVLLFRVLRGKKKVI